MLAARIDTLEPGERLVLERASVEGRSFHSAAVIELLPERERSTAAATLHSLVRRQLIKPDSVEAAGGDAFRFAHALVREAAYEGLPKRLRAEYHERVGDWLATRGGETDEIVGYHLEQAHRHWHELGFLGPRTQGVGRDAATRLDSAARGALQRGDLPGAIGLLERAASLLPPEDVARTALSDAARCSALRRRKARGRRPRARRSGRHGAQVRRSGASSHAQGSSANSCGYTASRAARPWRTRGMRPTVR